MILTQSCCIPCDTDCDGMRDERELLYGLNPNDPADAASDRDGGGTTNLREYLASTDPTDPVSCLRQEAVRF